MPKTLSFILLSLALSVRAAAADHFLQILHVNDLHSYWESNEEDGDGGYARIKTILDTYERAGNEKGWITVRLDAGDFADGHINFWADRGASTFRIEKALNFDAIALGNHDYLTGLQDLFAHQADESQRLPLLASNFFVKGSRGLISAGKIVLRGGLTIAIGGATLKSEVYNWAAYPARFGDPDSVEQWLKNQRADVRIALTHVGLDEDRRIARKSSAIDIIIGGHTHSVLAEPDKVLNDANYPVTIGQTGAYGSNVGQLVFKISDGSRPELVDFHLIRVSRNIPGDPEVSRLVDQAEASLRASFGSPENRPIATALEDFPAHRSRVPLLGNFFGDAMREATHAEIALDSAYLYGEGLKKGPVTVADIYGLAPHTFNWADNGWHIYTCYAKPRAIQFALSWLARSEDASFVVSGLEFAFNSHLVARHLQKDGQPLDFDRRYLTAFSQGFMDAMTAHPWLAKYLCRRTLDTKLSLKDALIEKAKSMKVFSKETLGPDRIHFWQ